jgi:LysR family transcriptional regulator, cys regulon transcriptional activator
MTLQQLRYLCGIVREGYSVSRAARALATSQPAISKQVRLLESELGADLLIRRSNRILGLTAAGEAIIEAAQRTLWEADNLERITAELTAKGAGRLVIATTHMYARYVLRSVIRDFVASHRDVQLVLRQGIPSMIAQWVAAGEADIGLSGMPLDLHAELVLLPFAALTRSLFVPRRHPLTRERRLTLRAIARFPIITLDQGMEGGRRVMDAFASAGIAPNIVLSAIDADVVKAYVELGLGIAVLLAVAYEPERDRALRLIDAAHLFEPTTPHIMLRHGKHLPTYMHDFIGRLTPHWDRPAIEAAMRSKRVRPARGD